VLAPEGDVQAPEGDGEPGESNTGPAPPVIPDDATTRSDDRFPLQDDDDDALSLVSLPEDIDPDQFPLPDDDDDPVPELSESDDKESDDESAQPTGRGRGRWQRNRQYWNDNIQVKLLKKAPRAALN